MANRKISYTAPSSSSMTNIDDILSPVVMFEWIKTKIKSLSEDLSTRYMAQALERQSANVLQLMKNAFEREDDDIAELHFEYIRTHLHMRDGQSQKDQEDFLLISYQLWELTGKVVIWKVEKKKRALRQRQKSDEEENRKYNLNSALFKRKGAQPPPSLSIDNMFDVSDDDEMGKPREQQVDEDTLIRLPSRSSSSKSPTTTTSGAFAGQFAHLQRPPATRLFVENRPNPPQRQLQQKKQKQHQQIAVKQEVVEQPEPEVIQLDDHSESDGSSEGLHGQHKEKTPTTHGPMTAKKTPQQQKQQKNLTAAAASVPIPNPAAAAVQPLPVLQPAEEVEEDEDRYLRRSLRDETMDDLFAPDPVVQVQPSVEVVSASNVAPAANKVKQEVMEDEEVEAKQLLQQSPAVNEDEYESESDEQSEAEDGEREEDAEDDDKENDENDEEMAEEDNVEQMCGCGDDEEEEREEGEMLADEDLLVDEDEEEDGNGGTADRNDDANANDEEEEQENVAQDEQLDHDQEMMMMEEREEDHEKEEEEHEQEEDVEEEIEQPRVEEGEEIIGDHDQGGGDSNSNGSGNSLPDDICFVQQERQQQEEPQQLPQEEPRQRQQQKRQPQKQQAFGRPPTRSAAAAQRANTDNSKENNANKSAKENKDKSAKKDDKSATKNDDKGAKKNDDKGAKNNDKNSVQAPQSSKPSSPSKPSSSKLSSSSSITTTSSSSSSVVIVETRPSAKPAVAAATKSSGNRQQQQQQQVLPRLRSAAAATSSKAHLNVLEKLHAAAPALELGNLDTIGSRKRKMDNNKTPDKSTDGPGPLSSLNLLLKKSPDEHSEFTLPPPWHVDKLNSSRLVQPTVHVYSDKIKKRKRIDYENEQRAKQEEMKKKRKVHFSEDIKKQTFVIDEDNLYRRYSYDKERTSCNHYVPTTIKFLKGPLGTALKSASTNTRHRYLTAQVQSEVKAMITKLAERANLVQKEIGQMDQGVQFAPGSRAVRITRLFITDSFLGQVDHRAFRNMAFFHLDAQKNMDMLINYGLDAQFEHIRKHSLVFEFSYVFMLYGSEMIAQGEHRPSADYAISLRRFFSEKLGALEQQKGKDEAPYAYPVPRFMFITLPELGPNVAQIQQFNQEIRNFVQRDKEKSSSTDSLLQQHQHFDLIDWAQAVADKGEAVSDEKATLLLVTRLAEYGVLVK